MAMATFSSFYFTIKAAISSLYFTIKQLLVASTLDNYSHSNCYFTATATTY